MSDIDLPSDIKAQGAAHWMCQTGDIEIIQLFLMHNIDINRIDGDGRSCIDYLPIISENELIPILDLLYNKGFDINLPPSNPISPYIKEVIININIIRWFLSHGSNPDKTIDYKTPTTLRQHIKFRQASSVSQKEELNQLIEEFKL